MASKSSNPNTQAHGTTLKHTRPLRTGGMRSCQPSPSPSSSPSPDSRRLRSTVFPPLSGWLPTEPACTYSAVVGHLRVSSKHRLRLEACSCESLTCRVCGRCTGMGRDLWVAGVSNGGARTCQYLGARWHMTRTAASPESRVPTAGKRKRKSDVNADCARTLSVLGSPAVCKQCTNRATYISRTVPSCEARSSTPLSESCRPGCLLCLRSRWLSPSSSAGTMSQAPPSHDRPTRTHDSAHAPAP
ncbi:hypothetical protein C8T65DRAFT_670862 [Cerioporus squamosus]|nr:hypothetical protein C8T65DRAFT_670862 [Cerioporus squamosus]